MTEKQKLPKAWRSWREERTLVGLVAAGIKLRDKRKALEREAEVLKKEEQALKDMLIAKFTKEELREVKTEAGTARLVPKEVPQPKDWQLIYAYIAKTKSWDLMQRRLHEGACKERKEQHIKIPGVEWFHLEVLKLGDAE